MISKKSFDGLINVDEKMTISVQFKIDPNLNVFQLIIK